MLINKILNNNVVVILNEYNEEQIVMGRGIAFKKKIGDFVDENMVDKVFILSDKNVTNKFKDILEDLSLEYIEIDDEIISYAKDKLNRKVNDSALIPLSDHLQTAVNRHLDGIDIKNVLLWDIKRFYKDEFSIGL